MTLRLTLIVIFLAQLSAVCLGQTESAKLLGTWKVEVTFANSQKRELRFEAREAGKGSLLLVDPQLQYWGPAKSSDATWALDDKSLVTITGPVEFRLGNIGRDAGILVLKGTEKENELTGTAMFLHAEQDARDPQVKPAKSGSFKAVRTSSRKSS